LANLVTVEMFEAGTDRAADIVILTRKSILTGITQWIELIAPVALEIKPFCRGSGTKGGGSQVIFIKVIGVSM
jgi:hypothetical protein